MLWIQFILQNMHFAVHLLAALAFFSVFWLYFDAWIDRRVWREVPRLIGFLTLALSFVVSAGTVETAIVSDPLFANEWSKALLIGLRLVGYGLVGVGIWLEPLQPSPNLTGISKSDFASGLLFLGSAELLSQARFLVPIMAGLAALLYLRRGTLGLEFHVRALAKVLFGMAVVEAMGLAGEFRTTSNVDVLAAVTPFGYLWIAELLLLLICSVGLLAWVWRYLLKRLETQLFMLYTATILTTFLIITVVFTGLLVKNVQDEVLEGLGKDVRVLEFALDSKLAVAKADAEALANNLHVQRSISEGDVKTLLDDVEHYLLSKTESMMVVTNADGKVLARGEDRDKLGDSLSNNPLMAKALGGDSVQSVVIGEGALNPRVWVQAAAPVRVNEVVIGAVMTGLLLDNAFVDGVQKATSLQTSIYADNVLAATTLRAGDGVSRFVGTRESNEDVYAQVLGGEPYLGGVRLFNSDYFGAYHPLKNNEGAVVGMLFVGTPQTTIYTTAGRSVELTFLIAAGLIVLSIMPSKLVSNYIVRQLR